MSNIDLHDLRMQEFPHYVRLALNKLEMCVQSPQSPQIVSLQSRLIEEFIFCSHDTGKPNNKHVKILMLSVNELTVVRMIISHLTTVTNDPLRNTLLMRLFHPSNMEKSNIPNQFNCEAINNQKVSHRLNILASLCSLSLASKNAKVLESIAVWMLQICNLSGWSLQVGRRLVAEYCTIANLNSAANHPLIDLPQITSLFTSTLIACWAQTYAKLGLEAAPNTMNICLRPPKALISLIVSWLQNSPPSLLLTPLTDHNIVSSLPAGAPFPPVTLASVALMPLLRWTVEAPFFMQVSTEHYHRINCLKFSVSQLPIDDSFNKKKTCERCINHFKAEKSLYEDLQLQLIKCLHEIPFVLPSAEQRKILRSDQLLIIIRSLHKLLEFTKSEAETDKAISNWLGGLDSNFPKEMSLTDKQEAVYRLSMVILITTKTETILGDTGELLDAARRIPISNRLLKMI